MPGPDDPTSLDWELMPPSSSRSTSSSAHHCRTSIPTDVRFQGKTIVVTGAGGQLGREGCVYFCQRGCRVVALDLSADGLTDTYRAILMSLKDTSSNEEQQEQQQPESLPFVYKPYVVNVTDAAAVQRVVQHIVSSSDEGTIDLLWNNAGYQGQIAPIVEQDPADFASVMNVNVTGMFVVLQAVGKVMIAQQNQERKGGSAAGCAIVNTASVAGLRGTPAMVGYASSKAAVLSLTVCAAKEWAPHRIRVNALSPALIGPGPLWERQNALHAAVGAPYFADTPAAVAAAKIGSVPLQRLGSAEEVVRSVAFLLSEDASYTTGINLTVDGGMSAGLKA